MIEGSARPTAGADGGHPLTSASPMTLSAIHQGRRERAVEHAVGSSAPHSLILQHMDTVAGTDRWDGGGGLRRMRRAAYPSRSPRPLHPNATRSTDELQSSPARPSRGERRPGMNMHRARHTFATELRRDTGDLGVVQRMLGHPDIQTTEAFYGHYDLSDLEAGDGSLREGEGKARIPTDRPSNPHRYAVDGRTWDRTRDLSRVKRALSR